MWNTITKYLLSWVGDYWSIIFKFLTYGAAVFIGFYGTYLYYNNEIKTIENEHLQVITELKNKAIIQLQEREKETARIISERDNEKEKHETTIKRLNDTVSTLSAKLHNGGNSSNGNVSANSSNSPKSAEELQQRGRELQTKCFRLLVRGADLVGRISADKDAVVKLATQGTKETK